MTETVKKPLYTVVSTPLNCELSGGGIGIHWENLDEDLYVPNLLMGITDVNRKTKTA